MKKLILLIPVVMTIAGCDPMQQSQAYGTLGGAAIGAAVTPNDPRQGALIGGAVGLAAGTVMARNATGDCTWQRPDGSQYMAPCP